VLNVSGGSATTAIFSQRVATAHGWGYVVDDPYSTPTCTRDNLTPATRRIHNWRWDQRHWV